MSRIALLRTEFISMLNPCVMMPSGILQLTSVLEARGHGVLSVTDMSTIRPKHVRGRLEKIADSKPDVIGLSSVSQYLPLVETVSGFFKKRLPDVKIVVGGPLAGANPDGVGRSPHVDFGIMGEGEESFPALVEALENGGDYTGIPGLVYSDGGRVKMNPVQILQTPLDDLPFIAWDRVDFQKYGKFLSMTFRRSPFAAIFTSRGCPFGCIYCHKIFGHKFRARSADNVMAELRLLKNRYGIGRIEMIDDIFNWDYDRATEILTRIRDELPGMRVGFGNGLRLDLMDEPFVKLMADVRCHYVGVPIESAVPRVQKLIRKNVDFQRAEETIRLLKKYKIHTWGFFMIGFPTESFEEMETTIDYADKLPIDFVAVQAANPFEGTKMAEMFGTTEESFALGNVHGSFTPDKSRRQAINNYKLKIMRKRLFNPVNWYFLWNLATWKIWWLGPKLLAAHLYGIIREQFSKDKIYTIDIFEGERSRLHENILSSLR